MTHRLDDLLRDRGEPIDHKLSGDGPRALAEVLAVFRKWLHLDDIDPLLAVAGAAAANYGPGDAIWLLLVGAPSTGKTEILQALSGLPEVQPVATLTEAALLSGTPRKDTAAGATGGVLRKIGTFGILLAKDFTSVLAQNKDVQGAVLAALREISDGKWDRPIGADGGRVLSWAGKCGFIGGVTSSYDRYHAVINNLGNRFLLIRMPAGQDSSGRFALTHIGCEDSMRNELADALSGLIAGQHKATLTRPLTEAETDRIIRLVAYTRRARTGVERDHQHEVLVLPDPEGPGRLILTMRRLLGGLEAIGCDSVDAWRVVTRVAVDSVPAVRTKLLRRLVARPIDKPLRTSDLAVGLCLATKTVGRHLDDLMMLGLVERSKHSGAVNSPDLWAATYELRRLWLEPGAESGTASREGGICEDESGTASGEGGIRVGDREADAEPLDQHQRSFFYLRSHSGPNGSCPARTQWPDDPYPCEIPTRPGSRARRRPSTPSTATGGAS